jgi:hypothetical protein
MVKCYVNFANISRYDIASDEFTPVFSLNSTYNILNSSASDLIDFSRDFETKFFRGLLTCSHFNDSCGNSWGMDVAHPNSFGRAKDGSGRYILSIRHTSQVILLDESFVARQVIGGKGENKNTYKFIDKRDRFTGQHSARIDTDGSLLLFDNGFKGSRALRLFLDNVTMNAYAIWQFNLTRFSGQVAHCCGSVSVNPAGNIITHDSNPFRHQFFNIYEADGRKNDTPIAILTMNKYIPPNYSGQGAEKSKYFHNHNVIYRTAVDTDIDGEHVVCDTRVHPTEINVPTPSDPQSVEKAKTAFSLTAFFTNVLDYYARNSRSMFLLYVMLVMLVLLSMFYYRRNIQFYYWKYFIGIILLINFVLAAISFRK